VWEGMNTWNTGYFEINKNNHTCHYTFVQTHTRYNTKREP
jgi:hypothetical protein